MDRRTQTQIGRRTVDDTRLEIDARTLHDHALVELPPEELIIQSGIAVSVGPRAGIVVLLAVIYVFALIDALNAERRADIDLVVDVGADRQRVLPDRTAAPKLGEMTHLGIVPDPGRLPAFGIIRVHLIDQKSAVSQRGIPELGGDIVPVPVARTARVVKIVLRNIAPIELARIDIADGRPLSAPLERIVVIQIGETVVSEADIEAYQRTGALIGVDRHADIGHRETVARIASVLRGIGLAPGEGHHRRDRNVAVPVHAQARRIDRHRRKVGSQRRESPGHSHSPRSPEIELGLRQFDHIPRHQHILIHQQAAPASAGALGRSRGRRCDGRKQ